MKQESEKNKPLLSEDNSIWNVNIQIISAAPIHRKVERNIKHWKLQIILN